VVSRVWLEEEAGMREWRRRRKEEAAAEEEEEVE
jgi:hypothetical protein